MDMIKIGEFIKEQRNKLNLTQNELSEKLYVTRQAISNWENGKTLPDSDILLKLSELFHVTINDILCGETIEQITLELVDDNNKKRNIIKRIIIIFISIILLLLFSFLTIYFINNYNSIKVYKVSAESNHFKILDGLIISTSNNTYFKLGYLEKNRNEDINIERIRLKEINGKKEQLLFESDSNNSLFINYNGYNEIHKNKFNKYKDNLYLEIIYNDNEKDLIKLKLKEDYKNDYFLILENNEILNNDLLEKEKISYEQKRIIRNDEKINNNKIIYKEIPKEIIKIEYINNSVQEEIKPVEEEIKKEIDYEEILTIIKDHGTKEFRSHKLEYQEDKSMIMISELNNCITLEVIKDNIIEEWVYNTKVKSGIQYKKYEDFEIVEEKNISEEEDELIGKMNNYLELVYQEKE